MSATTKEPPSTHLVSQVTTEKGTFFKKEGCKSEVAELETLAAEFYCLFDPEQPDALVETTSPKIASVFSRKVSDFTSFFGKEAVTELKTSRCKGLTTLCSIAYAIAEEDFSPMNVGMGTRKDGTRGVFKIDNDHAFFPLVAEIEKWGDNPLMPLVGDKRYPVAYLTEKEGPKYIGTRKESMGVDSRDIQALPALPIELTTVTTTTEKKGKIKTTTTSILQAQGKDSFVPGNWISFGDADFRAALVEHSKTSDAQNEKYAALLKFILLPSSFLGAMVDAKVSNAELREKAKKFLQERQKNIQAELLKLDEFKSFVNNKEWLTKTVTEFKQQVAAYQKMRPTLSIDINVEIDAAVATLEELAEPVYVAQPVAASTSVTPSSDGAASAVPGASQAYREVDVPGDGSCLFYSISFAYLLPALADPVQFKERYHQLFGERLASDAPETLRELLQSYHGEPNFIIDHAASLEVLVDAYFRKRVVDYIRAHREEFAPFIEPPNTIDSYCEHMGKAKSWGSGIEIAAMSKMLNCEISVFQKAVTGNGLKRISGEPANPNAEVELRIVHARVGVKEDNHYHYLTDHPFSISSTETVSASASAAEVSKPVSVISPPIISTSQPHPLFVEFSKLSISVEETHAKAVRFLAQPATLTWFDEVQEERVRYAKPEGIYSRIVSLIKKLNEALSGTAVSNQKELTSLKERGLELKETIDKDYIVLTNYQDERREAMLRAQIASGEITRMSLSDQIEAALLDKFFGRTAADMIQILPKEKQRELKHLPLAFRNLLWAVRAGSITQSYKSDGTPLEQREENFINILDRRVVGLLKQKEDPTLLEKEFLALTAVMSAVSHIQTIKNTYQKKLAEPSDDPEHVSTWREIYVKDLNLRSGELLLALKELLPKRLDLHQAIEKERDELLRAVKSFSQYEMSLQELSVLWKNHTVPFADFTTKDFLSKLHKFAEVLTNRNSKVLVMRLRTDLLAIGDMVKQGEEFENEPDIFKRTQKHFELLKEYLPVLVDIVSLYNKLQSELKNNIEFNKLFNTDEHTFSIYRHDGSRIVLREEKISEFNSVVARAFQLCTRYSLLLGEVVKNQPVRNELLFSLEAEAKRLVNAVNNYSKFEGQFEQYKLKVLNYKKGISDPAFVWNFRILKADADNWEETEKQWRELSRVEGLSESELERQILFSHFRPIISEINSFWKEVRSRENEILNALLTQDFSSEAFKKAVKEASGENIRDLAQKKESKEAVADALMARTANQPEVLTGVVKKLLLLEAEKFIGTDLSFMRSASLANTLMNRAFERSEHRKSIAKVLSDDKDFISLKTSTASSKKIKSAIEIVSEIKEGILTKKQLDAKNFLDEYAENIAGRCLDFILENRSSIFPEAVYTYTHTLRAVLEANAAKFERQLIPAFLGGYLFLRLINPVLSEAFPSETLEQQAIRKRVCEKLQSLSNHLGKSPSSVVSEKISTSFINTYLEKTKDFILDLTTESSRVLTSLQKVDNSALRAVMFAMRANLDADDIERINQKLRKPDLTVTEFGKLLKGTKEKGRFPADLALYWKVRIEALKAELDNYRQKLTALEAATEADYWTLLKDATDSAKRIPAFFKKWPKEEDLIWLRKVFHFDESLIGSIRDTYNSVQETFKDQASKMDRIKLDFYRKNSAITVFSDLIPHTLTAANINSSKFDELVETKSLSSPAVSSVPTSPAASSAVDSAPVRRFEVKNDRGSEYFEEMADLKKTYTPQSKYKVGKRVIEMMALQHFKEGNTVARITCPNPVHRDLAINMAKCIFALSHLLGQEMTIFINNIEIKSPKDLVKIDGLSYVDKGMIRVFIESDIAQKVQYYQKQNLVESAQAGEAKGVKLRAGMTSEEVASMLAASDPSHPPILSH